MAKNGIPIQIMAMTTMASDRPGVTQPGNTFVDQSKFFKNVIYDTIFSVKGPSEQKTYNEG